MTVEISVDAINAAAGRQKSLEGTLYAMESVEGNLYGPFIAYFWSVHGDMEVLALQPSLPSRVLRLVTASQFFVQAMNAPLCHALLRRLL